MKIGRLLGGALLVGILVLVPRLTTSAMGGRGDASRASVTVSLPAVADVSLAAEFPDDNFNDPDFPFLEVDYWHNPSGGALTYVRLFLVRFDLTGLPANAVIDSAALQLHPNSCTKPGTYPVTMGSFYVTSDWYESTVTYNMRPTWGTVGVNNQVDCLPENPTTWYITSFAQAWQSDPVHNYGVKVSAPWTVGLDYSIAFNSREYYGTDLDPALVITYHLPTPTSTNTLTPTRTSTRTSTTTLTPTRTRTPSKTLTPTNSPTGTLSPTFTLTTTRTPTRPHTSTSTPTPTRIVGGESYLPLLMKPWPANCAERLGNGDFQTGALPPWVKVGDVGLGPGRESAYGGWLGGKNNASGELNQWVVLPAGTDPVVWQFWWKAEVASAQPNDILLVRIESEAGDETRFLTLRAEGMLNAWRQDTVDLTAYAGQRILVSFLVQTDGSLPTTFRVDDVTLRVCG